MVYIPLNQYLKFSDKGIPYIFVGGVQLKKFFQLNQYSINMYYFRGDASTGARRKGMRYLDGTIIMVGKL